MASAKKKGGKKEKKTISLNDFLSDPSKGPAPSYVKSSSWADEMENDDTSDDTPMTYGASLIDRSALPTAPRAARGPDVDMSKVPSSPPFTAFLGNLPFDVNEDDIMFFFQKLKILNVRLPEDQGRAKGFGYAEFEDRQNLIDALSMNDEKLKNRQIRVDLAGSKQGDERGGGRGRGGRNYDDDAEDRTIGDWRKKPADDDRGRFGDDRGGDSRFASRDIRYHDDRESGGGGGGGRYGDRDRYGNRDRDGGGSRFGDRDRGYGGGRDDRDGGGRRQFGSGYARDGGGGGGGSSYGDRNDRGYGRDDRRSGYGDRDRGSDDRGGYERRRYSPPRDRYGGDRDRGYGGDRGGDRNRGGDRDDNQSAPKERPRLQLQPRSKPAEATEDKPTESRSSSIFGSAKPVDTSQREKEIEKKIAKSTTDEKLEPPKKTSASIFGAAKPVDTAAREKQIEERLIKEKEQLSREADRERDDRREKDERVIRRTENVPTNRRRSSEESNEGRGRERRVSSSSSGKVAPPPGTGSARVKRDSARSDEGSEGGDRVFDEDRGSDKGTSPGKKEEVTPTKLVPAPAPSVNIWEQRKQKQSPNKDEDKSTEVSPASKDLPVRQEQDSYRRQSDDTDKRKQRPTEPRPRENRSQSDRKQSEVSTEQRRESNRTKSEEENTAPGGPPVKTEQAPAPTENVWDKRKKEQKPLRPEDCVEVSIITGEKKHPAGPPVENAWGKPRDAPPGVNTDRSPQNTNRGGRGGGTPNAWTGRGGGSQAARGGRGGGRKPEKQLPRSVDEMPKYSENRTKDFSEPNKFAGLMGDEDDNQSD